MALNEQTAQGVAEAGAKGAGKEIGASFLAGNPVTGAAVGQAALTSAGIAAGAAVGAEQIGGVINAVQGEDLSLSQEAALALPTAGFSFAIDPIKGVFSSKVSEESKKRDKVRGAYSQIGLWDNQGMVLLPDGTTFNAREEGPKSDWANPDKRTDKLGADRKLESYEIDYTNDLDYVAGMGGITLSRLLAGGSEKHIDQIGNQMGNGALGSVGRGKKFTEENFTTVMGNMRAMYAKAGIQSKDEMLALANKMYSEDRIKDTDYAVMQQTASLVFENDYNTAQSLMDGRWKGVETANQSPSNAGATQPPQDQNKPGRIFSPVLSPEEAMMSVQPYIDQLRANAVKVPQSSTAANIAAGATGLLGGLATVNKLTGGAAASGLRDAAESAYEGALEIGGDILEGLGLGGSELPIPDVPAGVGAAADIFSEGSILETGNIFGF